MTNNDVSIIATLRKWKAACEVSVYIRITKDRNSEWVRLPYIKCHPSEWVGKYGEWISKKNREHKKLNLMIEEKLLEYKKGREKISQDKKKVSPTDVVNTVELRELSKDFLQYWASKTNVEAMPEYNQRKGYNVTLRKIKSFIGCASLPFEEMTPKWLKEFEDWQKKQREDVAPNTIKTQAKRIRKIWNEATLVDKIVNRNLYPFGKGGFSVPENLPNKKEIERLEEDEMRELMKLKYEADLLVFYALKGFLLSFNCSGIRAEDLLCLKWSNIRNGVITYKMSKGSSKGKVRNIKVTPIIAEIISEIKNGPIKSGNFILPFLDAGVEKLSNEEFKKQIASKTSMLNGYLREIADDAGIGKRISTHVARHSWAAYVYGETKDILLIRDELNHSNAKITETYIGKLGFNERSEQVGSLMGKLASGKESKLRVAS